MPPAPPAPPVSAAWCPGEVILSVPLVPAEGRRHEPVRAPEETRLYFKEPLRRHHRRCQQDLSRLSGGDGGLHQEAQQLLEGGVGPAQHAVATLVASGPLVPPLRRLFQDEPRP